MLFIVSALTSIKPLPLKDCKAWSDVDGFEITEDKLDLLCESQQKIENNAIKCVVQKNGYYLVQILECVR